MGQNYNLNWSSHPLSKTGNETEFPKSIHVEFPQEQETTKYDIHMNTSCKVASLLTNMYSSLV